MQRSPKKQENQQMSGEMFHKKQRVQHCSSCKNHGIKSPKRGHRCRYGTCDCILCKLLKLAQMAMRHQQRVWRHQKMKLKCENGELEDLTNLLDSNGETKSQVCDKCRNHNLLIRKRNHQCKFSSCNCDYCTLTFKRREIMKHLQRVRRSGVVSDAKADAKREVLEAEEFYEQNKAQYEDVGEENNSNLSDEDPEFGTFQSVDDQHSLESREERQSPCSQPCDLKNEEALDFSKGERQWEDTMHESPISDLSASAVDQPPQHDLAAHLPTPGEQYNSTPEMMCYSPPSNRPPSTEGLSPPPLIKVDFTRTPSRGGACSYYPKSQPASPTSPYDKTERKNPYHREQHLATSSIPMKFTVDRVPSNLQSRSGMIRPHIQYSHTMSAVTQLQAYIASLGLAHSRMGVPMEVQNQLKDLQMGSSTEGMYCPSSLSLSLAHFQSHLSNSIRLGNGYHPIPIRPEPLLPHYPPLMRPLCYQMDPPRTNINFSSDLYHPPRLNFLDPSRQPQIDRFQ